VKSVRNLLHLLAGVALLAMAAYFFRQLADNAKMRWKQESSAAQPARSAKSRSASDDPISGVAKVKVYGVLNQQDDSAGGNDAVLASSSGPPSSRDPAFRDPAYSADAGAPNHFLHRHLTVKTFQFFEFEVPAHATRPELEGTFQSVATMQNPDGAPVEVSLMNAGEFARFLNHKPVVAQLTSPPSSGAEIYWKLKAPASNPQKYYLVFKNSSTGQGPSIVDADFTASFE
jgi:hypothetical protein